MIDYIYRSAPLKSPAQSQKLQRREFGPLQSYYHLDNKVPHQNEQIAHCFLPLRGPACFSSSGIPLWDNLRREGKFTQAVSKSPCQIKKYMCVWVIKGEREAKPTSLWSRRKTPGLWFWELRWIICNKLTTWPEASSGPAVGPTSYVSNTRAIIHRI